MTGRSSGSSVTVLAITFFFSLVAFGGVLYVASLAYGMLTAERIRNVDTPEIGRQHAQLVERYLALTAQVKRLDDELGRLRDEITRRKLAADLGDLEKQAERLAGQLETIRGAAEATERALEKARGAIAELRTRREEIERSLQEAKKEVEAARRQLPRPGKVPVEVVVPEGSRRDALFVECDGRGVLVMPDEIRYPADPGPDVRRQFLDQARRKGYVVFFVRPEGFDSFREYREIVEENGGGIDYGYEPVDDDWQILYPTGVHKL